MKLEEKRNILKNALIESFVNDYEQYKKTIDNINHDLIELKLDFQYKYDDFCAEFLDQSLNSIESIDIFDYVENSQFQQHFFKFSLYNLRCMLDKKFNELGFDYKKMLSEENNINYN